MWALANRKRLHNAIFLKCSWWCARYCFGATATVIALFSSVYDRDRDHDRVLAHHHLY
jgi:hypothetical protein